MSPSQVVPRDHVRNIVILVGVFALTRAFAYYLGLRPLTSETVWFMQFLDLNLLRDHLARSLLHLHCQPPFLNALVGIAEKIGGPNYGTLIIFFNLVVGLCAIISVYVSIILLRVSSAIGLSVALFLLLNPSEILSEFDPFYTVTVIAIHCFLILATICYLQRRSKRSLYCIVGLAVLMTLTRSSYQWIWVFAIFAVLWWQIPQSRRQIRMAAFVSLFLSLLWPLKNQILFHHFISTTWGPLSMSKHFDWNGPAVQGLARQGLLPTWSPPDAPEAEIKAQLMSEWQVPPTGYPELDDISKATGGAINWNSLADLRRNDALKTDISVLLHYDSREYITSVLHSVSIYFYPSTQYYSMFESETGHLKELAQFYEPLRSMDTILRYVCCNVFGLPQPTLISPKAGATFQNHRTFTSVAKKLCIGAMLLYAIVLVCILTFHCSSLWSRAHDRKVAAMIMCLTIAYSFTVVNLVEIGENQRYRFETQALVLMAVAIFLQQLWDYRSQTATDSRAIQDRSARNSLSMSRCADDARSMQRHREELTHS